MRRFQNPWRFGAQLTGGAIWLVLAFVLLHPRASVPRPEPPPPRLLPVPVDPQSLDLQLTRNIQLRLQPFAAATPEPPPSPTTHPAPPPPLPPGAREAAELAAAPQDSKPASATPTRTAGTPEELESAANQHPMELPLRPRYYVHPYVSERALRKRKIDASVLMQSHVGSDGRVLDVRVLRSIPDCEECNHSAIAAARGFVYHAPIESGAIWTTPFELHFTYRR